MNEDDKEDYKRITMPPSARCWKREYFVCILHGSEKIEFPFNTRIIQTWKKA